VSNALASPSGIAVRGRPWVAALGLALLLLLPVFAVPVWASAYADVLGNRIAAWLIAVVPAPPPPPDPGGWEEPLEPQFSDAPGAVRGAVLDAKRARRPALARPTPKQGIFISSAQILALAARRAMPSAVYVKANAQRPGGLLLSGVSALGVGLQDGDVLTEAAGQKASSVAAVVGLVLAARARQAAQISGRFYRGNVPFSLTVEQPYPKAPVPG